MKTSKVFAVEGVTENTGQFIIFGFAEDAISAISEEISLTSIEEMEVREVIFY